MSPRAARGHYEWDAARDEGAIDGATVQLRPARPDADPILLEPDGETPSGEVLYVVNALGTYTVADLLQVVHALQRYERPTATPDDVARAARGGVLLRDEDDGTLGAEPHWDSHHDEDGDDDGG